MNRLHDVLCQLIPGGAKRHLSATRARQLLSAVRPRDAVGKARKQLALDYLGELERLDARLKELKKSLTEVLDEHPSTLREINGVGPINAAKILAETGDVRRFPSKAHFASYTGTAPVDVSTGDNNRHRLNRGGNRRLNHALHIAAVVQYRMPGPGPGLLPAQARPGQDPPRGAALPQTATLRRRLPPPRRRPGSREPGRTSGGVSSIQRG